MILTGGSRGDTVTIREVEVCVSETVSAEVKHFESNVLNGYNGTMMAYGQTGTVKHLLWDKLGDEDTSDRGIIVRAMKDILAGISLETDFVSLYMDNLQDLLKATNDDIPIVEDPPEMF